MAELLKFTCMMLIAAAAVAPAAEAAIGCGVVTQKLTACLPFVTGQGPLGGCCAGIKSLNSLASTTPDRQAVCSCLKSLSGSYPGVDLNKAAGLPGQCGVSLPYKLSPSTDCTKVQ